MDKIDSVLVAIDRGDAALPAFSKAIALAAHCGARLELFLCDAEGAYALKHAYDLSGIDAAEAASRADSRQYLDSLVATVNTGKVPVTVDTMCESPLYEGIVHKTQRSHPDLVIRSVGGTETLEPGILSATDWHLVRTCPVPLMLVRGNSWRRPPRLAAAIDVTDQPALTQAILRAGAWLAQRCEGSLEILHADSTITADEVITGARRAQVCEQVSAAGVQAQQVHVVAGDPAITLPTFAASRRYDLLVLGALTHRKALTDLVGTLTGRLIQALDCDFLLVKPAGFVCPVMPR